jgi:hypothetical protein
MFESRAKVEYHTDWVIAACDNQLLDYYRWWVKLKTGVTLSRPKHGAHISIVRGDIERGTWIRNMDGETITFYYKGDLEAHDNYIWLPVWGENLGEIREKTGLPREPGKPFHMTVGTVDMTLKCVLERSI